METLKNQLKNQFLYNRKKNLFCEEEFSDFGFAPATVAYIKNNLQALKRMNTSQVEALSSLLVDKALESLCQANQFYHFNSFDRDVLKRLYRNLFSRIKDLPDAVEEETIAELASQHYRSLQGWVKSSNPFAKALYKPSEPYLQSEVVCGEYSAQAQLELLQVDLGTLQEPVLDLGCGSQAFLVRQLRSLGVEAFGLDRNATGSEWLYQADWFEFDLTRARWGTIISNLGFSNHFQHHHLRVNGDHRLYALRFMEILESLKPGGAFYYAPDLPFIEQYLSPERFTVRKITIQGTPYSASKVVKQSLC
ncbi:class I SAM-dependent methyltransferase [Pontibacter sp. MBLB2868]|uniref:class I SAM-dependent methyltransferase n=1 Tax=Pontibacter sp. MBLB2868 TaxID=3451555 RepID=UPI003F752432